MRRDGWPVGAIHGDKTQPERDQVLNGEFRPERMKGGGSESDSICQLQIDLSLCH